MLIIFDVPWFSHGVPMIFPWFSPYFRAKKKRPETVSSALSTGCSTGSGACRGSGEITGG
jgi:hypothetical protein